jgi:membrane fusion protein, multidrug efflux system
MPCFRIAIAVVLALASIGGCRRSELPTGEPQPVVVSVSHPIERDVVEYAEFTGRTEAPDSVEIKSRVTGYLLETPFKEGSEVEAGQILCEIDPRTYQAEYEAAKGQLEAAEAKLELAKVENDRAKSLYELNPKAISLKALDQHHAAEEAAAADVVAAASSMEVYKLNLEFCQIVSPISGRVGRYQITIGNLVTQNVTPLTTVVSQDPMYVYFNIDEQTMLKALRNLYNDKLPPLVSRRVKVGMELQDETGFPHIGVANFANNTVDSSTGTLTVRAEFNNPPNEHGLRLLMPGMFVRIHLPLDLPTPSLLVAEQAAGTDQGQKFLYVVDDQDTIQYRSITLGQVQKDGLQVVTEGVHAGDRVVVSGLQLVRPGAKVKTELVSMTEPDTLSPSDGQRNITESAGAHSE